jgi:hypothetical protein
MCSVASSVFVGLLTGALSSFYVARTFHRNSRLDRVLTLVKFCCPYRTQSERPGDGLSDTGHALIIESEILAHAWFTKPAHVVRTVAAEMEALPSLPVPETDADKAARNAIKAQWQDRILHLYRPFWLRRR